MDKHRDRRNHRRVQTHYRIRLRHPRFGMLVGCVENMSEGGVFVSRIPRADFRLDMEVEAQIIGECWDLELPPLTMRVVRIGRTGVAMVFTGASVYLSESNITTASCDGGGE